jgi:hypothetical protein
LIARWHEDFPGVIAGLVNAALPEDRVAYAAELAQAGLPVHLEYVAGESSSIALRELVCAAWPSAVSVHVQGADQDVDRALAYVLAMHPQRVVLPWPVFTAPRVAAIRAADCRAWVSVWDEWDGRRLPAGWMAEPDGIQVMLAEPTAPERCRIRQVKLVSASVAGHPAIPVATTGGVTESVARLCLSAGAQQVIVGKALYQAGM